ncbi:MAG: GIY-YIG nuclease family protein [Desulfobacterales bacterium]|nr:GIY-YIG nuclease family protein [Desulfobacterales bacterium]
MINKEPSHLYLLLYPQLDAFKVGKADIIQKRVDNLKRYWGEIDYKESFYLETDIKTVFEIEKILHLHLRNYTCNFEKKEGYTEFFKIDALEKAKLLLKTLRENDNDFPVLKKGIIKPVATTDTVLRKKEKWEKLSNKNKSSYLQMSKSLNQMRRIKRLMIFLLRFQDKIPYQWEIKEDRLYFAFLANRNYSKKNNYFTSLRNIFCFESSQYFSFTDLLENMHVIEPKLCLFTFNYSPMNFNENTIRYVVFQNLSQFFLKNIPRKSLSCKYDILEKFEI